MAKVWLPTGGLRPKAVRDEKTGREMILFLPEGAATESRSHEQEIAHAAEERAIEQMRAKGPIQRTMSRQEVGKRLKEYRQYLADKQKRTTPNKYTAGWR